VLETNKIYQGDSLKILKTLETDSVDIIITSPPYNLGNNHHTGNKKTQAYNDNYPEFLYQENQVEVLNECFRVLKKEGSMFYNHKNRIKNGVQISPYEWLFKCKFIIKQELVWFNRSQNFDKIRFYPMTERIYWLTKAPKTKLFNTINHHDVFDTKDWKPIGSKGRHTRAFPEKMVEDILKCFPDSEIVMDNYCGSGTTCKVARMMGKKYIGIEMNEEYAKLAEERVSFHKNENN
jgi:site-specific DNA-methyltransferase (adenine-specific)